MPNLARASGAADQIVWQPSTTRALPSVSVPIPVDFFYEHAWRTIFCWDVFG